ncbi:MAG TPA: CHRD domain-containing protein, partial [Vicinamibacterales bacterium]|nr:CHRD domain-containing protein [Vicinamibacterales bacterium]
AISGPESSGTGTATITFHLTRDSGGAIQSGTVDFQISASSFPAGTSIINAHIHGPAGAGATANVLIPVSGLSPATPLALPNGSGSFQVNGVGGTDAATLQAIIDNPANYYFNIHSSLNPGGVARGQLAKQ